MFVQAGQTVIVWATGTASCGFSGIPFNCDSLVGTAGSGNMFTDYSPFVQLETEGSITTSTSGNPTLLFVDGCPECHGDNSGGFNATIALCSAPV